MNSNNGNKNMNEKFQQEADEKEKQKQKAKDYGEYVKQITPTRNLPLQMLKAFLVGGIFCTLGQIILNTLTGLGLDKETAGIWCSVLLVLLSVILTGFSLYQKIADFGGAGALVPITGFANGVAAPAIEFKKEGHVFGIGAQIFTIGGPVILFGIFTSWMLGLIYWVLKCMGVV